MANTKIYVAKNIMCRYNIRSCIRDVKKISSIPITLSKIINVLKDEKSTIDDIADVIRHDQAIASRVLAIGNSPYFGFPEKINSIEQAILVLGIDIVRSITVGVTVFSAVSIPLYKLKKLWAHSYIVGLLSGHMSHRIPMLNEGACFLSGLLHDIGRVVLYTILPEEYEDILKLPDGQLKKEIIEKEYDTLSCDHAEAGGIFLQGLFLPEEIIMALFCHHDIEILSVLEKHQEIAKIIYLAEGLTDIIIPEFSSDGLWTPNHEAIFKELGFDNTDKDSFRFIIEEKKEHINNFFGLIV
jgi:HD-like signal output (HDOD) protein